MIKDYRAKLAVQEEKDEEYSGCSFAAYHEEGVGQIQPTVTATKWGQQRQLEQLDFSDELGDPCMMLGPIAVECYVAEVPIKEALSGTAEAAHSEPSPKREMQ